MGGMSCVRYKINIFYHERRRYHRYPYIKRNDDGCTPNEDEEITQITKIVSPYAVIPSGTYMGWPEEATFRKRITWLRDELQITGDAAIKVSTRLAWFPRHEFPMETYKGHYSKVNLD